MTATLDRLADAATNARGGADLFRFGLTDPIPVDRLAKGSDGSVTITGVDLLKSGTFNGLTLLDTDLETMVAHFSNLRDAGVFVPPFRLDHSWSVLSVVGWHDNLETYRRVDTTDNLEKAFLRGDLRITGSVDYTPTQIVDAIKRGSLVNRSSELGYYVTNSGVELPLVFYGSAFVDIPAVEGLSAVKLHRPEPHSITNLSLPEGNAPMTDETTSDAGTADETVETGPGVPDPAGSGNDAAGDGTTTPADGDAGNPPADEAAAADQAGDQAAADEATPPPADGDQGTPAGETTDAPAGAPADEVETLRREVSALRAAAADREIATLSRAGVIVEANRTDAEYLLRHTDPEVRRSAGAALSHLSTLVTLGARRGRTTLSADGTPVAGGLIVAGMSKDEVGPLWANLTSEERRTRQAEYDAWSAYRRDNGITD